MITFGLSLALRHRDGAPALPALQAVAAEWWARRRESGPPKTDTERATSGKVWEFSGDHVNKEETGLWTTELRAFEATEGSPEVAATLTMRIQSGDAHIRPLHYSVRSPQLLRDMDGPFVVRVASELCRTSSGDIDDREKVERLVADLGDSKRVLPIVIVSETQDEELLLPNLDSALAKYLFGLARVVRLRAYQTQQLTNRLGKVMSCFHGGVRVYWPGWKHDDWPLTHRLFTRFRILGDTGGDLDLAERRLAGSLMGMLARATVGSFEYPTPMLAVIDAARAERLRASGRDYEKECFKLLDEVKRRDEAILLLEKRLAAFEANAAAGHEADPAAEEATEWDYSVPQAIAAARIDFKGLLVIPDGMDVDGSVSGGTIYFFLKSLRDLCARVRAGDVAGNPGDLLKDLLAKNGVSQGKFKTGDTGVYATLPDGKEKECRSRYHLRSGAPANTESVYWAEHGEGSADRVYVVARIGVHA